MDWWNSILCHKVQSFSVAQTNDFIFNQIKNREHTRQKKHIPRKRISPMNCDHLISIFTCWDLSLLRRFNNESDELPSKVLARNLRFAWTFVILRVLVCKTTKTNRRFDCERSAWAIYHLWCGTNIIIIWLLIVLLCFVNFELVFFSLIVRLLVVCAFDCFAMKDAFDSKFDCK